MRSWSEGGCAGLASLLLEIVHTGGELALPRPQRDEVVRDHAQERAHLRLGITPLDLGECRSATPSGVSRATRAWTWSVRSLSVMRS